MKEKKLKNKINKFSKILYFPVVTEKSLMLQQFNQYVFHVNSKISKSLLKLFFEIFFEIKIISINKLRTPLKKKTSNNLRKIIIKISQKNKFLISNFL